MQHRFSKILQNPSWCSRRNCEQRNGSGKPSRSFQSRLHRQESATRSAGSKVEVKKPQTNKKKEQEVAGAALVAKACEGKKRASLQGAPRQSYCQCLHARCQWCHRLPSQCSQQGSRAVNTLQRQAARRWHRDTYAAGHTHTKCTNTRVTLQECFKDNVHCVRRWKNYIWKK